jgi:putative ABC transport system ATP-binding protein
MSRFELRDVTVRRDGQLIVDRVSATIAPGLCTALVGPSGAGKSTLLRLFNRLDDPTSGTLSLDGAPLESLDVLELRRRVGWVSQRPVMVASTVSEELRAGAPRLERDAAVELLERVGLSGAMLERPSAGLSGGEAQRVCLARALAVGPEVLLLDEPTSALDPVAAAAVEETICGLLGGGMTAVLVSHSAEQVRRMADEALVLREGRVVERGVVTGIGYVNGSGERS